MVKIHCIECPTTTHNCINRVPSRSGIRGDCIPKPKGCSITLNDCKKANRGKVCALEKFGSNCACRCFGGLPKIPKKVPLPKPPKNPTPIKKLIQACHQCSTAEAVRTKARNCCNFTPLDVDRTLDEKGNKVGLPPATNLRDEDLDCAGFGGVFAPLLEPLCVGGKSFTKGAQGVNNFIVPIMLIGGGLFLVMLLK